MNFTQTSKDNILPRNLRVLPSLPLVEVESDWIVINFDAASRSSFQRGSVGYVAIRDKSLALRERMAWASMKPWRKVMFSGVPTSTLFSKDNI
ncbi:conserved hypothetical protein [Ricinus communis]|uniref:Uncharacterized protein n=1 Tax=Ricinus communis TaxID=3988 RepID=B9SRH0_RICCO|nr:conserved hypothetical protein [Ricinus communis]